MRGHNILFDLENDRIGFAESSCNYESLITHEEHHKSLVLETNVTHRIKSEKTNNDCVLAEPKLESYCWESIDVKTHCVKGSNSKKVEGLATYNAAVLKTGELCEDYAKTLLRNIDLVQCFPEPYCDIVTTCETTCGEVMEKSTFYNESIKNQRTTYMKSSLRNMTDILRPASQMASKSINVGVMLIIVILSAFACCIFREDEHEDMSSFPEFSFFLKDFRQDEQELDEDKVTEMTSINGKKIRFF